MRVIFSPSKVSLYAWTTNSMTASASIRAAPMACQRCSPASSMRSGPMRQWASSNTSDAISKETPPCFRWLCTFLIWSHSNRTLYIQSVVRCGAGPQVLPRRIQETSSGLWKTLCAVERTPRSDRSGNGNSPNKSNNSGKAATVHSKKTRLFPLLILFRLKRFHPRHHLTIERLPLSFRKHPSDQLKGESNAVR